jgi:hypothetical protein
VQVDELVANGGLSEAYKQQLQRAEQAADEAKAGLAALEGKLVASAAVAEAQVCMSVRVYHYCVAHCYCIKTL